MTHLHPTTALLEARLIEIKLEKTAFIKALGISNIVYRNWMHSGIPEDFHYEISILVDISIDDLKVGIQSNLLISDQDLILIEAQEELINCVKTSVSNHKLTVDDIKFLLSNAQHLIAKNT